MKKIITFLISSLILMSSNIVNAADKIVFGTNWLAQGGHGGFYQAIADGTYKKHGLDVEIMMGGPQMNNRHMLIAGKLDFLMTVNLLLSFENVGSFCHVKVQPLRKICVVGRPSVNFLRKFINLRTIS